MLITSLKFMGQYTIPEYILTRRETWNGTGLSFFVMLFVCWSN